MGSSSSTSSSIELESNTMLVNNTDLSTINKTVNKQITENITNDAKSCSNAANINQNIDFSSTEIGGDFTFTGGQTAKAFVDFSCVQVGSVLQKSAQSMKDTLMDSLQKSVSANVLDTMNAKASSAQESGFGSFADTSTATDVKQTVNFSQTTNTRKHLENLVESEIRNKFTTNTISDCINTSNIAQNFNVSGAKIKGSANVVLEQEAALDAVGKCIQNQQIVNNIASDVAKTIGLDYKTVDTTVKTTAMEAEATAESKSTGPIGEVFAGVSGVLESIGNIFGLGGLGGIIIVVGILAVCCFSSFLLASVLGGNEPRYSELGDEDMLGGALSTIYSSADSFVNY